MEEIIVRGWENFVGRTTGPMNLRFVMQPCVAAFLAIRAGLKDSREGKPAYLWSIFTSSSGRRELLHGGFKDTSRVFAISVALDFIYQLIAQRGVYALELLFTAVVLALVPYAVIRGPVNRFATWNREIGTRHASQP